MPSKSTLTSSRNLQTLIKLPPPQSMRLVYLIFDEFWGRKSLAVQVTRVTLGKIPELEVRTSNPVEEGPFLGSEVPY